MVATSILVASTSVSLAAKPAPKPVPTPGAVTLSIAATPNPVTFGTPATVSGALSSKAVGVTVELQATPYPFTDPFKTVQTKATTTRGLYAFTVAPDRRTRYRAVAKASPSVTSSEVTLSVRWRVGFNVSDSTPARGTRVRFSGSVRPAHPGGTALVQKRTSTGWKTVTRTTLRAATASYSTYSIRVRVGSSASYRVRVSSDVLRSTGTSRTRALTVH